MTLDPSSVLLTDRVASQISVLRTSLPHLGDESSELKALLNRAETSAGSRDFEGAFAAIGEGQRFVDERTRNRADEIATA